MKALIIGGAGFVGGYLADHLRNTCKWSVSITKMPHEDVSAPNDINVYDLDILCKYSIRELFQETRPDCIIHLAAQSSVALSWSNPGLTVDVNVKGSINILDSIRDIEGYNPRILLIGSGEEYGYIKPEETPINEENLLRPGNIYAATKACQNMIGSIYAKAYNMDIIMVRAFNHIGPNQSPIFVVSDFCKQVAEIEKGLREPIIKVGNLSAKRDFTDVRDVVRAYSMLIEKGQAGETYNVGSGKAIAVQDILNLILTNAKIDIAVEVDEKRLRPVDVPIIEADINKIQNICNWSPIYKLEDTLKVTLDYWRNV